MKSSAAKALFGVSLLAQAVAVPAQQAQPDFENGLIRAVTIKGQPDQRFRIADRMAHYKVPGVSVAIMENCKIVLAKGYGVAAAGRPVDSRTLFQAASMSKPVAALGALVLVDQGKLDLDADVAKVVKSWAVPVTDLTRDKPVTLRGLLSHGAGLTIHGFDGYPSGKPIPTIQQVLTGGPPANSGPVKVAIVPGTRFEYSGGGYTLAQLIMSEAVNEPFPNLMKRLVLDPAGMTDSSYEQPLPAARATIAAHGHRGDGAPVPGSWHVYPEMAAAGLWTTPSDLLRYAQAVIKADRGEPGAVVSRKTAKEMLKVQIGTWGLGPHLGEPGKARSFGHGGANEGFRGQFMAYPETCQGAAVMTNGDNGGAIGGEILRAISTAYRWPDPVVTKEMTMVAMTPAIVSRFAGSYHLEQMKDYKVQLRAGPDGILRMVDPGGGATDLVPATDTALFAPDSGVRFEIDPTTPGRYKFWLNQDTSYVVIRDD